MRKWPTDVSSFVKAVSKSSRLCWWKQTNEHPSGIFPSIKYFSATHGNILFSKLRLSGVQSLRSGSGTPYTKYRKNWMSQKAYHRRRTSPFKSHPSQSHSSGSRYMKWNGQLGHYDKKTLTLVSPSATATGDPGVPPACSLYFFTLLADILSSSHLNICSEIKTITFQLNFGNYSAHLISSWQHPVYHCYWYQCY